MSQSTVALILTSCWGVELLAPKKFEMRKDLRKVENVVKCSKQPLVTLILNLLDILLANMNKLLLVSLIPE